MLQLRWLIDFDFVVGIDVVGDGIDFVGDVAAVGNVGDFVGDVAVVGNVGDEVAKAKEKIWLL